MNRLLDTPRLLLRHPSVEDTATLVNLAGRREIADTTISIPHPYTEENAVEWIQSAQGNRAITKQVNCVIALRATRKMVGAVALREIDEEHNRAELGVWIGVDHWGQGYATEAVSALAQHAFQVMGLNRLYAHHMVRNPASGRVLAKAGFQREGLLRQCVRKWGIYEDVVILSALSTDRGGHPVRGAGASGAARRLPR